jgi:hypothetical protein
MVEVEAGNQQVVTSFEIYIEPISSKKVHEGRTVQDGDDDFIFELVYNKLAVQS